MLPTVRGHFRPKGHNLIKLGKVLLVNATYKTSKFYALWFQTRSFLKFLSRTSMFSLCDQDMQRTKNIWTFIKAGDTMIILVKCFQIPASSLEDVFLSISCWQTTLNARHTTDAGHPTITIAHHEHMSKVSQKLNLFTLLLNQETKSGRHHAAIYTNKFLVPSFKVEISSSDWKCTKQRKTCKALTQRHFFSFLFHNLRIFIKQKRYV